MGGYCQVKNSDLMLASGQQVVFSHLQVAGKWSASASKTGPRGSLRGSLRGKFSNGDNFSLCYAIFDYKKQELTNVFYYTEEFYLEKVKAE